MAHIRTDIGHRQDRHMREAAKYLPDKQHERHRNQEISPAEYVGLTSGQDIVRDARRWKLAFGRQTRFNRGKTPKMLSYWPIVRQADGVNLTPAQHCEINNLVNAVLGVGCLMQTGIHTPRHPKPGKTKVAGPEYNCLVAAWRKIGPWFLPLRTPHRSFRRELIRVIDQLTRRWNRQAGQEPIPEMPEVRRQLQQQRISTLHVDSPGQLALKLASTEEQEWKRSHPHPTKVEDFTPRLSNLRGEESAARALARLGYEIDRPIAAAAQRTSACTGTGPRRTPQPLPKAKEGFWWVRHKNWDALREKKRKKKRRRAQSRERRARIMVDALAILTEARQLYRELLLRRQQAWELKHQAQHHSQPTIRATLPAKQSLPKQSLSKQSLSKQSLPKQSLPTPAKKRTSLDHRTRQPTRGKTPDDQPQILPKEFLFQLEDLKCPPFSNPTELYNILRQLQTQALPQTMPHELKFGGRLSGRTWPYPEVLIHMQLALLRGQLQFRLGGPARFLIEDPAALQELQYPAETLPSQVLNPFHSIWLETHECLDRGAAVKAWRTADRQLTASAFTPLPEKLGRFHQSLIESLGAGQSKMAFVLAAMHNRCGHGTTASLLRNLSQDAIIFRRPHPPAPPLVKTGEKLILLRRPPKAISQPAPGWQPTPDPWEPQPHGSAEGRVAPAPVLPQRLKRSTPKPSPQQTPWRTEGKFPSNGGKEPALPKSGPLPRYTMAMALMQINESVDGEDRLPKSDSELHDLLSRMGFAVRYGGADALLLMDLRTNRGECAVPRSILFTACHLAIIRCRLSAPSADPDYAGQTSMGTAEMLDQETTRACGRLSAQLLTQRDAVELALFHPATRPAWDLARSVSDQVPAPDARQAIVLRYLCKSGVPLAVAKLLALAQPETPWNGLAATMQTHDRIPQTGAGLLHKLHKAVSRRDPLPPALADLRRLAGRADIALVEIPGEDSLILLRDDSGCVAVDRDELRVGASLVTLRNHLASGEDAGGIPTQEFNPVPVYDSHPHDRHELVRRCLDLLTHHGAAAAKQLANRDVAARCCRACSLPRSNPVQAGAQQTYDSIHSVIAHEGVATLVTCCLASSQKASLDMLKDLSAARGRPR